MSVVYYQKNPHGAMIISDGIMLQGDIITSASKLQRLKSGVILGMVGDYRINQYIAQELNSNDIEEVSKWKLKDAYKRLSEIIKEFHTIQSLKEHDQEDSTALIIIAKETVFSVYLSEDCKRISVYDESEAKEVSIGYDEHLLGAIWCGEDPVYALAQIIPHHSKLDFPIKKIEIGENDFFNEVNLTKEAFKYVDC